jgi:hypothetical protein
MALWPALAAKVGVGVAIASSAFAVTANAATTHPPAASAQTVLTAEASHPALLGTGPGSPFAPHVPKHRLPVTRVSKALSPPPSTATVTPPAPPPPPPAPVVPPTVRVYDSTTPAAIPSNAQAVAGYVSGPYAWSPQQWAAFPNAAHIGIDTVGGDTNAAVEDVEPGAVQVSAIHSWALAKQSQGQVPIIYSSTSDYPAIQQAMTGIYYHWWAAQPTGQPHGVPGSDGTQWYWGHSVDMSVWNRYMLPKATSPPPAPVAAAPVVNNTPGAGLPPIFANCIINAESSGNATDPDGLYGILPSTWASLGYSGLAGQAPIATQNAAALTLYQKYGLQPWYDPCTGR